MNIVIGSYENVAENYQSLVDHKPFHVYYERPNLVKHIPQSLTDRHVLDLGCGTGWYSELLKYRGAQITAVDCSEKMVKMTLSRLNGQLDCRVHDLNQSVYFLDDRCIDLIVAPLVIHYIKDWVSLFNELHRILKPGGRLVFSTHNPYSDIALYNLQNYFECTLVSTSWDNIGEVQFYHHSMHDLFASIRAANFQIITIEEPLPSKELEHIQPELYQSLTTKPCLLFGLLEK